jgi:hypothetical protein
MSDQPAVNAPADDTSANATTASKPKAKRTRKPKADTTYSVQSLARARLRKRGVKSDERLSDECKVVRGILRSNFADVRKNDASVRKAKDAHNDRKPWPTNMNARTYALVVEGKKS